MTNAASKALEPTPEKVFRISPQSLRHRTRNLIYGAGLSLVLIVLVAWGHWRQPETYNDLLLWSMVGFLVLANLVGYLRHRRYLRLVGQHRLEVTAEGIRFRTGDDLSQLSPGEIAEVTIHRRGDGIGHIQIRRTDSRGIRLEGYDDADGLVAALEAIVPAAHWRGR
jgi:hypothetical protein